MPPRAARARAAASKPVKAKQSAAAKQTTKQAAKVVAEPEEEEQDESEEEQSEPADQSNDHDDDDEQDEQEQDDDQEIESNDLKIKQEKKQSNNQSNNRRSSGRARKVPSRFTIVEEWPSAQVINQAIKHLEEDPASDEQSINESSANDDDDGGSKRRKTAKGSKKVTSKKSSKKSKKSKDEDDDDEQDEEDNGNDSDQSIDQSNDNSDGESKPKKRKRSTKQSTKQSSKKLSTKAKAKLVIPLTDQTIIQAINDCKSCLSATLSNNEPDVSCCSRCSNRETFRAIHQSNTALLNTINKSTESVSDPLFAWSPDDDRDPLTVIIKQSSDPSINQTNNFAMFKILFNQLMVKLAMGANYQRNRAVNQSNDDPSIEIEEQPSDESNNQSRSQSSNQISSQPSSKPLGRGKVRGRAGANKQQQVSQPSNSSIPSNAPPTRTSMPVSGLVKSSTGVKNYHAYGHATRAINQSRGGKEGNDAFVKDRAIGDKDDEESYNRHDYDYEAKAGDDVFKKYFKLACQQSIAQSNKQTVNQYVDWMMSFRSYSDPHYFAATLPASAVYQTNKDTCLRWITQSMIQAAAESGNYPMVHYLIGLVKQSSEQSNNQADGGFNALHQLVVEFVDQSPKPLPTFRAPSAIKKSSENSSITPIHLAAINPSTSFIAQLHSVGGPSALLVTDSHGRTACHYAAANQSDSVLKWLVARGADLFLRDKQGKAPIDFAIMYGRSDNIKYLVPQGVKKSNDQAANDQTSNQSVKAEKKKSTSKKSKAKAESEDEDDETNDQSNNQAIDLMDDDDDNDVAAMAEATAKAGGRSKQSKFEAEQAAYSLLLNDPVALLNAADKKTGETILHRAIKHCSNNQAAIIAELIQLGADATKQDKEKKSPLMLACMHGDLPLVESIIDQAVIRHKKHPVSISKKSAKTQKFETPEEFKSRLIRLVDRCKCTALTHAVKNGKFEIVKYLLIQGCDPNSVDSSDNSLLHYAAAYGWSDCLDLLIAANADVSILNMWKLTPLFIAMLKNHLKIAEMLLSINQSNSQSNNQSNAASNSQALIDSVDSEGRSVLFHALFNKTQSVDLAISQVKFLAIDRKANVRIADVRGSRPLHVLSSSVPDVQRWKDVQLAKLLIDSGCLADMNESDESGETALSLAVVKNHWQLVELFLANGANVITRTKKTLISPLIHALKISPISLPEQSAYRTKTMQDQREYIDRCMRVRAKFIEHRRLIVDALVKNAAKESNSQSDDQMADEDDSNRQSVHFDFLNSPTETSELPLFLAVASCQPLEDAKALMSFQTTNRSMKLDMNAKNSSRGFGCTALAMLLTHEPELVSVIRPLDNAEDDEDDTNNNHHHHYHYHQQSEKDVQDDEAAQKAAQQEADACHIQTIKLLLANGASVLLPWQSEPKEKPQKPGKANKQAVSKVEPATGQLRPTEFIEQKSLLELALTAPTRLKLPLFSLLLDFGAPVDQIALPNKDTILHTLFRQAVSIDVMQFLNLLMMNKTGKSSSKKSSVQTDQAKQVDTLMTIANIEGMAPIHVLIQTISPMDALTSKAAAHDLSQSTNPATAAPGFSFGSFGHQPSIQTDNTTFKKKRVYINTTLTTSIDAATRKLLSTYQSNNISFDASKVIDLLQFCLSINKSCFSLSIQPIDDEVMSMVNKVGDSKTNQLQNQSHNPANKPHCKYGSSCYRTGNPKHISQMFHEHIDGQHSQSQSHNTPIKPLTVHEELEALAKEYQSVKQPNKHFTPLHQAVAANDAMLVKWLVQQDQSDNHTNKPLFLAKDSHGRIPLHLAVQLRASVEIPKVLLQQQSSSSSSQSSNQSTTQASTRQQVEAVDLAGMTALHCAVEYSARHHASGSRGFEEAFGIESLLLEAGSNVNSKDKYGRLPLHYVFVRRFERYAHGSFDAIELLTDLAAGSSAGVDMLLDEPDVYLSSPLLYNAMLGGSISGKWFLHRGSSITRLDEDGNGPFQHALLNNHLHHCVDLVDKGVNFLTPIYDYRSASQNKQKKDHSKEKLTISCFKHVLHKNWMGLAFLMMERGIDPQTAVSDALSNDLFQLARTLISKSKRTELNNVNDKGQNLLHILAGYRTTSQSKDAYENQWCKKIVDLLLNLGVDYQKMINTVDNKRRLPLHYAAMNGHDWLINWLIDSNKDSVNELDYQSRTPFGLAVSQKQLSSIVLLVVRGASPSTPFVSYPQILAANEKYQANGQSSVQANSKKGKQSTQSVSSTQHIVLDAAPVDKHTLPPLMLAIRMSDSLDKQSDNQSNIQNYFLVLLLLTLGADPNCVDENGSTPLMLAAKYNDMRLAFLLMLRKDSPDHQKDTETKLNTTLQTKPQSNSTKHSFKELPLDLNRVDSTGRSALHFVVIPFGPLQASYENVELLNMIISGHSSKNSLKHVKPKLDLKDSQNHSALYYACQQASGVLSKALQAAGAKISDNDRKAAISTRDDFFARQFVNQSNSQSSSQVLDLDGDVKALQSWFDAEQSEGQSDVSEVAVSDSELAKTSKVFVDVSGSEPVTFDCTLSFTDTGAGYYGKHSFYRMQIVHNVSQDLYILWNNWGRHGTSGEMQRTPMSDKAAAIKEFEKVFKQKTANAWDDRSVDKFTVKPGKYTLLRTKEQKSKISDNYDYYGRPTAKTKIDEKSQVVLPLNYMLKQYASQLPACTLPSELAVFVRTICDLASLKHLSQRLKVQEDEKNPLAAISEEQLKQGRQIIQKISDKIDGYRVAVEKVSEIQQKKNQAMMASFAVMHDDSKDDDEIDDDEKDDDVDMEVNTQSSSVAGDQALDSELADAISVEQKLNSELAQLSNEFYTVVPRSDVGHSGIQPLRTRIEVNQQLFRLTQMLDLFIAEKVLIGARWQLQQILSGQRSIAQSINPLTYCYQSLGVQMRVLPATDNMYKSIEQYMMVTADRAQWELYDVIECCRPAEFEAFNKASSSIDNRMLLWHGSSKANFCGLLTTGLRIAPPEAQQSGLAFGRGVYLADMFSKSITYCGGDDQPHNHWQQQSQASEDEEDASIRRSRCLLLCEAAIGKPYPLYEAVMDEFIDVPAGYQSGKAVGRRGPDSARQLVTPDGVHIPLGSIVDLPQTAQSRSPAVDKNEYIIYHEQQVRIRYVVRVGPPRKKNSEEAQVEVVDDEEQVEVSDDEKEDEADNDEDGSDDEDGDRSGDLDEDDDLDDEDEDME